MVTYMLMGGLVVIKSSSIVNGNIEIKNDGMIIIDQILILGNLKADGSDLAIISGSTIDGNIEIINHQGICYQTENNVINGNNLGCS